MKNTVKHKALIKLIPGYLKGELIVNIYFDYNPTKISPSSSELETTIERFQDLIKVPKPRWIIRVLVVIVFMIHHIKYIL